MDSQRFDKLARLLADGSDRRGFLKRVGVVVAGAAIVSTPARTRAADYGDSCTGDYDCGKHQHCYIPEKSYSGTCECDDGYEPYNGHCVPKDACFTDDDCNDGKDEHKVCVFPKDYPTYGYCECADGYEERDDYCWLKNGCETADDCYTDVYGYSYYENGKYYDKDGKELPPQECIYGVCQPGDDNGGGDNGGGDNGGGDNGNGNGNGKGKGKGKQARRRARARRKQLARRRARQRQR